MLSKELLIESISKQEKIIDFNKENNKKFKKELIDNILSQNIIIDLNLTRNQDLLYINKIMNLGIEDLINEMTMNKDFQERTKATNIFKNKYYPKIKKWIKENIKNYTWNRNTSVNTRDGNKCIEYTNLEDITKPYIKFFYKDGRFILKSFHDGENTFKKKSYNDTISYKFGSKDIKKKIKEQSSHFNY